MKSMIRELYFEKLNASLKKIFVLLLLTVFANTLFAQDEKASGATVRFGLKIEPAYAWLKAKDPLPPALDGDGSKTGFAFGLMAEFSITKNYSFATGIDISYRGGKLKSLSITAIPNGNSGDSLRTLTSTDASLEYIEIPLTLKMKTNQIGNFTYFGQFGIAPGINISSKADIHTQYEAVNNQLHEIALPPGVPATSDANGADIKSSINSFNLALIIGLGLEYSLGGTTTALAAITFNNGFLNVLDSKNANGTEEKAISNKLGLTLGILF